MAEDKFKFEEKLKKLNEVTNNLPDVLARQGQRFFQKQFDSESFNGVAWSPRKDTKNTKHLLVASGALRQAMQNTVRSASIKQVVWGVDLPYAKYQNYGTEHIPAREFIGDSSELRKLLRDKIVTAFNKVMGK